MEIPCSYDNPEMDGPLRLSRWSWTVIWPWKSLSTWIDHLSSKHILPHASPKVTEQTYHHFKNSLFYATISNDQASSFVGYTKSVLKESNDKTTLTGFLFYKGAWKHIFSPQPFRSNRYFGWFGSSQSSKFKYTAHSYLRLGKPSNSPRPWST